MLKAPDGSLRGVGFVQFIKPEDAARALAALHNRQARVMLFFRASYLSGVFDAVPALRSLSCIVVGRRLPVTWHWWSYVIAEPLSLKCLHERMMLACALPNQKPVCTPYKTVKGHDNLRWPHSHSSAAMHDCLREVCNRTCAAPQVGQRTLVVEQARSKVQTAHSYHEAAPSYIAAPGAVYMHAARATQGAMHAPYATMGGTAMPMGFARNPKDAAAGARAAKGGEHGAGMPLAYGYAGFGYGYGMPMYGAPMPGYGDQRNVYGAAANGSTDSAMYAGYGAPYGAAAFGAPYGPYGTYVPVSPADMQRGSFYMPHAVPYQAYEAGRGRARTRGGRSGSSIGGGSGGGGRGLYSSSRRGSESAPSSAPGTRVGSQGGASHRGMGSSEARLPNGMHAARADPVSSPAAGAAGAGDAPVVDAAATVVTSSSAAAASAQAGASAPPARKAELDEPVKGRTAANGDDAGTLQPAMTKLAVSSPPQPDCKPTAKARRCNSASKVVAWHTACVWFCVCKKS